MKHITISLSQAAAGCIVLCFLLNSHAIWAQPRTIPTINQEVKHTFRSAHNGITYQLRVSLPKGYSGKDNRKYPVLYLLDGNTSFPIVHAGRQMLDMSGRLEDLIIVGIGYEWDTSYVPWFTGRWNDLTPTQHLTTDTNSNYLGFLNLKKGQLRSGGASRFLNILKTEIFPLIEKSYNIAEDRGLAGHSFGGLFTAWCLFTEPSLFKRYGINSPSVWWDNKKLLDIENQFYSAHKRLDATVFVSVGSLEGESMINGMNALANALKSHQYAGLSLNSYVFENENHFSVPGAAFIRTLSTLYAKRSE